jgi:hypothetical protein
MVLEAAGKGCVMQNCPYCREEFTKKATIEHYQNMLKSSHRNMLMGVDLAS